MKLPQIVMDFFNMKGPEDHLNSLFVRVGRIVVFWAAAEQALDFLVFVVYHFYGGKDLENSIPRSLSKKTGFLEKCTKKIPDLAPYADELTQLTTKFTEISDTRHDYVHGAVAEAIPVGEEFVFNKVDYGKHVFKIRRFTSQKDEFARVLKEIQGLVTETAPLIHRIAKNRLPHAQ